MVSYVYSDEGPSATLGNLTSTILPSGTVSGTFIITRPYRYVTETTTTDLGYSATGPVTSTIRPDPSNTVGTILIESPAGYITSTVGTDEGPSGTITTFSTRAGSNGVPPTYFVLTPYPYSTFTTSYDDGVSGTIVITTIISVTNSRFGSVVISTPGAYASVTTGYDAGPGGTIISTSIIPAASNSDGRGTVSFSTPYPYITTQSHTDVGPSGTVNPSTSIISAASVPSRTGTLISIIPDRYDTSTVPYQGSGIISAPITSTIRPTSGQTVGTIQIQTQAPPVTSFTGYDAGVTGGPAITRTSTGPGVAPTVFISTAYPYITTTLGNDATTTFTSTLRPTGTNTVGSVIIYTHFMAITTVTSTSFFTSGTTFTSTIDNSGTATDTVVIGYLQTFNTVTSTSGTTARTFTLQTPISTTPGTIVDVQPTPEVCGNLGVQYAVQSNPYSRAQGGNDPTYSAFSAAAFQTTAPQATGVTRYFEINYYQQNSQGKTPGQIYGVSYPDLQHTAVNHRGYLFAKQGGTFTFNFPVSDDISLLWIGTAAVSTYARANANIQQYYLGGVGNTGAIQYQTNLTQGQYYPIRVLWANAQGDAEFRLNITAPDGSLITNGQTGQAPSPYLVQYSCDGVQGPQYPPFGQEGTGRTT